MMILRKIRIPRDQAVLKLIRNERRFSNGKEKIKWEEGFQNPQLAMRNGTISL
jgi:hypothetical protein